MGIADYIDKNYHFILVGCESAKKRDAMSEYWHVLVKYCEVDSLEVFEIPIRGLFLTALNKNPLETLQKIDNVVTSKKFTLQYCKKATPLKILTEASFENLFEIIPSLMKEIPETDKWRITVNRRHTKMKRREIITKVASHEYAPKGKVDLENPAWDIIIEIFGKWMGLGVFRYNAIHTYTTAD